MDSPDFYFRHIQEKGGLDELILDATPSESMILEIGGGVRPRTFSAETLRQKNILRGNVDPEGGYGDIVVRNYLQVLDELDDKSLSKLFHNKPWGSVILSHVAPHVPADVMERFLEVAARKIVPGGSVSLPIKFCGNTKEILNLLFA